MKNKQFKKLHKDMKKPLKIKGKITLYHILCFICLTVLITAVPIYLVGKSEGYYEKTSEINKEQEIEQQKDLMKKDVGEVYDIFIKFLMVKTMFWLPIILIVLGIGWILHGMF